MDRKKAYMTIQSLAAELGMKAALMEQGKLNAEQIDQLTKQAGELYERMIVLRYKAFEAMVHTDVAIPKQEGQMVKDEPVSTAEEPVVTGVEIREERKTTLRFGEPESNPKQISLIDSIEEIIKQEPHHKDSDTAARVQEEKTEGQLADEPPSLADKLKKTPVKSLKAAIGINQKFLFISNLFDGDKDAFQTAISRLDSCASFIEADEYILNELKPRYTWQMKNAIVKELVDLVQRRYL